MSILFHPVTAVDINSSFDFYQLPALVLGCFFIQELVEAFNTILSLPSTWLNMGQLHRRLILS
jgi:hypothetical protein